MNKLNFLTSILKKETNDFYIQINNIDENEGFQNAAFKLGYRWNSGDRRVLYNSERDIKEYPLLRFCIRRNVLLRTSSPGKLPQYNLYSMGLRLRKLLTSE